MAQITRLVETSDKLFIYAATAIRFIGDEDVDNPQRQLSIILGSRRDPHAEPYYAIDTLYLQVLKNAIPENRATRKQIESRNGSVVSTIVVLREPLPLPWAVWLQHP